MIRDCAGKDLSARRSLASSVTRRSVLAGGLLAGQTAMLTMAFAQAVGQPSDAAGARKDYDMGDIASISKGLSLEMSHFVDAGDLPGAQVMVHRGADMLIDCHVGYRDVEARVPIEKDTIFRIHSMTKPLTSVAIMMLVEQGHIRLDDPISRWLPEFGTTRVYQSGDLDDMVTVSLQTPITVLDLLTHTSGLTYEYMGDGPVQRYYRRHGAVHEMRPGSQPPGDVPPPASLDELVSRLAAAPLLHQPGASFSYGYSTTVLGLLIERVVGSPLDVALADMVTAPLGMKDTHFVLRDADMHRFATLYTLVPGGLEASDRPATSDYRNARRILDGGGGLLSTAADYMIFAMMLANGGISPGGQRLLSEASVENMFKARISTGTHPPIPMGFGLGFVIGDAHSEKLAIQPAGTASWAGKASSYFFVDLHRRTACIFMTQVLGSAQMIHRIAPPRQAVNRATLAAISAA